VPRWPALEAVLLAPVPRRAPDGMLQVRPRRIRDQLMTSLPPCPQYNSVFISVDGEQFVCPACGHEWRAATTAGEENAARIVRDAVGNVLADGDTITVIKDLRVKGPSLVVKVGTRVKNIRLVEGDHDVDCRIDGIGGMKLQSECVKKA